MTPDVDLVVVGSGFGGSLLAMVARRLGLRVALLERGQHPRFAIGESASPLAGVVLEQLADRYELPRVGPLAAYGSWQRVHPEIACGLKRGFTYFKHERGLPFRRTCERSTELLVAASPSDELSDTHWFRADVDHFLVNEAGELGAEYLDRVSLERLDWDAGGRPVVAGTRLGRNIRVRARAIVDASGPHGFLSRALGLDAPGFDRFPPTQALYSHFTGVARCSDLHAFTAPPDGDSAPDGLPPYAIDDAALHHVFDDGWMWVLRFGNGITSAGVAVTEARAAELRLSDGAAAWPRVLADYPSVAEQFADAVPVREFTWMPRVPFRASVAAGPRWAMLPSAAAFIDPLFSTGIPMTLLGIERLAEAMEAGDFPDGENRAEARCCELGAENRAEARCCEPGAGGSAERTAVERSAAGALADYSRTTLADADHAARFVAGCYAAFPRFPEFVAYSMLYFAAASYSEMLRRLGRVPPGFLGSAEPTLAAAVDRLSPASGHYADLAERVASAVAHVNVAGLCDPAKRNWYGVDFDDTVRSAGKLGATVDEVRAMLLASAH